MTWLVVQYEKKLEILLTFDDISWVISYNLALNEMSSLVVQYEKNLRYY